MEQLLVSQLLIIKLTTLLNKLIYHSDLKLMYRSYLSALLRHFLKSPYQLSLTALYCQLALWYYQFSKSGLLLHFVQNCFTKQLFPMLCNFNLLLRLYYFPLQFTFSISWSNFCKFWHDFAIPENHQPRMCVYKYLCCVVIRTY